MRKLMQPRPAPLKLSYFLTGFLVNAVVHRMNTGQGAEVLYPVAILVCIASLILLHERART